MSSAVRKIQNRKSDKAGHKRKRRGEGFTEEHVSLDDMYPGAPAIATATVDAAATELAAGNITKAVFEGICKEAWIDAKGPVPAGQMLCVELRGEEIVIGHQPIPKGLEVEAGAEA